MTGHDLRITMYPVAELRTYHRNPRIGNTDAIAQSLRVNGQYRPIVVNRGTHTGRPNEVLAGNHTLKAARDLGWDTIAAVTVDVDEDQAARIVLADNKTADDATYDDRLLLELLADLPDLEGTGYRPKDIEEIEKALAENSADDDILTGDAPIEDVVKTHWGVYVEARNEAHQAEILENLANQGYTVRPV